ncbi:MAG: HipA domain-containing protein [Bifidobacteriaceae bacterium]|jgi:serine/threonine-protein kinase HipA|nr:HipA domain-containing protein [Bifidobacteriaceae bacterium]
MSERILDAYLDGTFIGAFSLTLGGTLAFVYSDSYLNRENPTPLSLSMPLGAERFKNRVVLPFLQGLLPDNPLALESMAASYGVSSASPFALLEHMGHDVAGALQLIRPGEKSEDSTADRHNVEPITNKGLAVRLKDIIGVYNDGARASTLQRMSLAGAQAKLAMTKLADGTWAIPSRGVPTTHIFKPRLINSEAFPDSDIVELLCQNTLAMAGIPSAQTSLWDSPDGTIRAIVSQRYDRRLNSDGTYSRLHQEDLCQALSVPPSKKYQRNDGGPGVGQISRLFQTRLSPGDGKIAARRFLQYLTANAFFLNTDAHAKNYSLMLSGSSATMAPMYDTISIAAFLHDNQPALSSMKIGKGYDMEQIFPETLIGEGTRLALTHSESEKVVSSTITALNKALTETMEKMSNTDQNGVLARTVTEIQRRSHLAAR